MKSNEALSQKEIDLLNFIDKRLAAEIAYPTAMEEEYSLVIEDLIDVTPRADRGFRQRLRDKLVARIENETWNNKFVQTKKRWTFTRTVFITATIVLGLVILFSTNLGAAFAQQILAFFARAEDNVIFVEATEQANISVDQYQPEEHETSYQDFSLTLSEAGQIVDFELIEPLEIPSGFSFVGAKYDEDRDGISLLYLFPNTSGVVPSQIRISQYAEFEEYTWGLIGPEAEVQTVKIGDASGEYVEGGWIYVPEISDEDSEYQPGESITQEFHWEQTMIPVQTLRWKQRGIFLEITFIGSDTQAEYLAMHDILELARGLR